MVVELKFYRLFYGVTISNYRKLNCLLNVVIQHSSGLTYFYVRSSKWKHVSGMKPSCSMVFHVS